VRGCEALWQREQRVHRAGLGVVIETEVGGRAGDQGAVVAVVAAPREPRGLELIEPPRERDMGAEVFAGVGAGDLLGVRERSEGARGEEGGPEVAVVQDHPVAQVGEGGLGSVDELVDGEVVAPSSSAAGRALALACCQGRMVEAAAECVAAGGFVNETRCDPRGISQRGWVFLSLAVRVQTCGGDGARSVDRALGRVDGRARA
jgi:hypothetical protein